MTLAYPGLPKPSYQPPHAAHCDHRRCRRRARIAVGLSTCGGGGPCRANLWIGDPRDCIEHIVVHRHREGLALLLGNSRDEILASALERHPPQALRQIKPTALE